MLHGGKFSEENFAFSSEIDHFPQRETPTVRGDLGFFFIHLFPTLEGTKKETQAVDHGWFWLGEGEEVITG